MTDQPAPRRTWPIFGEPLPPGKSYPPVRPDSELFADEHELASLMADYQMDEKSVRFCRSLGFI